METMRQSPESCRTMADVRAAVDQLDRALVELLAERFRFMDAAARIKERRGDVRDEPRKREVIDNAARHAAARGIPAEVVEQLWETLVEASIVYELDRWDRERA